MAPCLPGGLRKPGYSVPDSRRSYHLLILIFQQRLNKHTLRSDDLNFDSISNKRPINAVSLQRRTQLIFIFTFITGLLRLSTKSPTIKADSQLHH